MFRIIREMNIPTSSKENDLIMFIIIREMNIPTSSKENDLISKDLMNKK
jgi:hypothetical protein